MKFALVSGKQILANVIRGTGYKLPSSYFDDILEWVPEGLDMLQATSTLVKTSTGDMNCPGELLVSNHCVALPCGFVAIAAVEDEYGRRLPEGTDSTDLTNQSSIRHNSDTSTRPNTFNVDPYVHQTSAGVPDEAPDASIPYFGEDLTSDSTTSRTNNYYQIQGNYIQTSFESGYIKLHYWALPVDKEGYPLIPNNSNFKYALEWHIIRRLIGAGYQHPVFSWKEANEQFEFYAARAMNEISYPSEDSMAKLNRSLVRLIPPTNYYEDFGVAGEQPEILRK